MNQPIATVPAPVAPPADGRQHPLVLTNDGNHWCGTFRVLITALLQDLLPEGPFTATITYLTDDDREQAVTGEVRAFEVSRDEITIQEDGRPFEAYVYLPQVLSFSVH